jgi:MFS family permease
MRIRAQQPLPREVRLLIAARAVNRLGAFSLPFLTVSLTTRFDASAAAAGFISAAFGLASIPSRLIGGYLADRVGRRRTITVGLIACAAAQLGIAASGSLPVVAMFAILLGLAFEVYEPPSQAMIADTVAATGERVRAYSMLNAALAVAGMAAGLLAAALGQWDLRWLFVVDAVTCLVCAVTVHLTLPLDHPVPSEGVTENHRADSPWRDPSLRVMFACGTLLALVYLQVMIALPLSLVDRGLEAGDAGLLSTASALTMMAGPPLLRFTRLSTLPASRTLASGYGLMALGLLGYAQAHTLAAHLVATLVWSLGDLLLVGRIYAIVADLAPPHLSGRYMAVYGLTWGIAGVAAPITGTQLLHRAGPATLWTAMAAVCLVLAVLQPAIVRTVTARIDRSREAATADGTRTGPKQ